jgi:hypothetical protein
MSTTFSTSSWDMCRSATAAKQRCWCILPRRWRLPDCRQQTLAQFRPIVPRCGVFLVTRLKHALKAPEICANRRACLSGSLVHFMLSYVVFIRWRFWPSWLRGASCRTWKH